MRPNRAGVSERTETMAAPGLTLRYSSAICSAGVFERTTLATSFRARRRSACCASSIPNNMTVGLDIVLRLSANEPDLPGGPSVLESRPVGRSFTRRLLHCTAAVVGMSPAVAAEQEQLHVAGIVELVVGRQVGGVVGSDRLGQVGRHHHQELGLVALVAHGAEQGPQDRD